MRRHAALRPAAGDPLRASHLCAAGLPRHHTHCCNDDVFAGCIARCAAGWPRRKCTPVGAGSSRHRSLRFGTGSRLQLQAEHVARPAGRRRPRDHLWPDRTCSKPRSQVRQTGATAQRQLAVAAGGSGAPLLEQRPPAGAIHVTEVSPQEVGGLQQGGKPRNGDQCRPAKCLAGPAYPLRTPSSARSGLRGCCAALPSAAAVPGPLLAPPPCLIQVFKLMPLLGGGSRSERNLKVKCTRCRAREADGGLGSDAKRPQGTPKVQSCTAWSAASGGARGHTQCSSALQESRHFQGVPHCEVVLKQGGEGAFRGGGGAGGGSNGHTAGERSSGLGGAALDKSCGG